jgi:hypothetical protein
MRQRFSRAGALMASAAFVIGSMIAIAGTGSAEAAPAPAERAAGPAKPRLGGGAAKARRALPAEEPKAAYTKAGPEEDGCFSTRRRLFVEGEGWIVRRVTTCR